MRIERHLFRTLVLSAILFFSCENLIYSQTSPSILSTEIETLSEEQIIDYLQQARAQGYTFEQIEAIAKARGVSDEQIALIQQKLASMNAGAAALEGDQITEAIESSELPSFGRTGGTIEPEKISKNPIFGYDFFNNENISFTPNLNVATPDNYQLGPGDELIINLWGSTEQEFRTTVSRSGQIRVPNVGPITVNGMPLIRASEKIKSSLGRSYSGISAPNNSPYKIFVDVSLAEVRTVQVNIIGEVNVPGTYSLSALSTVLNALYASGGPTTEGTFRMVKLVRNGDEVVYFDIYKYLVEGSLDGNKTLKDQDVIIVSPYVSRVSISGAVKRSGIYEMLPDENFTDLLGFVGGLRSNAFKDLFVLERIENDRKVIRELTSADVNRMPLKDGDEIFVSSVIDKYENRIQIEGAVYRPGVYEYSNNINVKTLIEKASGITEFAFSDRGAVFRKQEGTYRKVIPFSLSDVMNGKEDIVLQPEDIVRVYDKSKLETDYTLTIDGAVRNPNEIPFVQDMTVEDLVLMAGGFLDGANTEIIDVYREVIDDNFETLSESFRISSNGSFNLADGTTFKFQPNDRISVRYLKGFSEQKRVVIEGEANVPGIYSISSKNERISDLVKRAGGLSPYAFIDGASLIRKNPFYKEKAQINTALSINDENVEKTDLNNKKEFRVGINLRKILAAGDEITKEDMILRNGDRLVIPSSRETVKVEGEILASSLVKYDKSKTLKDYIYNSGGFSLNAKRSKVYVVHPNGEITTTKNFLFFRSYPKVKPGSIILVPSKPENRRKVTTQELVGITTGITALAILIDNLLK